MSLAGKVAIVTGAASGQGAAEARLFVEKGASVVITDVNPAGQQLADELGSGRAIYVRHDVSSTQDWKNVVAKTLEKFGRIDCLINNAGIVTEQRVHEISDELFDRTVAVNLRGPFIGIREVIPHMRALGGGSIVNIASLAATRGIAALLPYCASKWGLRGVTKAAALDLAKDQIRVNCVMPGVIETPILNDVSEQTRAGLSTATPLGFNGKPNDVAGIVVYLCSDEARFITGADIAVDGGLAAT